MDAFSIGRHDVAVTEGVARRHIPWTGLTRILVAFVIIAAISGCARYQFGNRTLYRTDLKTIQVPLFKSNTLRIDLGEWLTEAVIKEIEMRTPFKVVSDPLAADSVLTGSLLWGDHKQVLNENVNDEPRNLIYQATAHITWLDRSGGIMTQSIVSLGVDFVPEAGQSITTAEQAVLRKLARQIVSQMEAQNW